MEYYEKKQQTKKEYLTDLNLHIPEWAKQLVELYTSPLKEKFKKPESYYSND